MATRLVWHVKSDYELVMIGKGNACVRIALTYHDQEMTRRRYVLIVSFVYFYSPPAPLHSNWVTSSEPGNTLQRPIPVHRCRYQIHLPLEGDDTEDVRKLVLHHFGFSIVPLNSLGG